MKPCDFPHGVWCSMHSLRVMLYVDFIGFALPWLTLIFQSVFFNDNVILQPSSNWGSWMYVKIFNYRLRWSTMLKDNYLQLFHYLMVMLRIYAYQSYLLVSYTFNCYKLKYAHALVIFMSNAPYTFNCDLFLTWMV